MSSVSGCYPYLGDAKEVELNLDSRFYSFESSTILNSLDLENSGVFTRIEKTSQPMVQPQSITVLWPQADYLRIAEAVLRFVWQESPEDFNLSDASFTLNCSDLDQGAFRMAVFTFYKLISKEGEDTRVQYIIRINPTENWVYTSRAEHYPNMRVLEPTELGQYPITAEKALKIAEENGGAQKRSDHNNSCMIDEIINGSDGWTVIYQTRSEYRWRPIFKIAINLQTGSFKITSLKK